MLVSNLNQTELLPNEMEEREREDKYDGAERMLGRPMIMALVVGGHG
jgi:hypothetical protein